MAGCGKSPFQNSQLPIGKTYEYLISGDFPAACWITGVCFNVFVLSISLSLSLSLCKSANLQKTHYVLFRISLQKRGFLQVPFSRRPLGHQKIFDSHFAQVCPHGFLLSLLREHPCVSDVVLLATILRRFR